jgi:hypothetical protein
MYKCSPNKIYTMKKVFALVFALGAMTAVFAQGGYDHRNESRDVILGQNRTVYDNDRDYDHDRRYNHDRDYNNGYYGARDRDARIDRIRREYDWRIQSIQADRYLRRGEKDARCVPLKSKGMQESGR